MAKYNQKFWKERYSNENQIKEWFKNFMSFYSEKPTLQQSIQEFLEGEKEEIKVIFNSKKVQEEMYSNVEKVMENIKEWYKDEK